MSHLRTRGEPSGRRADAHVTAAACLGVWLLAGTAMSGLFTWGPAFSAVGLVDPASQSEGETRGDFGRRATTESAPALGYAVPSDERRGPSAPQVVDVNRADVTALQALPGVGPALARRIVVHRETYGPFRRPADLLQVPGVGAKRYARLEGRIITAGTP